MSDEQGIKRKKMKFGDEEFDVAYREATRPAPVGETAAASSRAAAAGRDLPVYVVDGLGDHPPLSQRTYEIADGIICEQDVAVPMRDGVITYADIFRPAGQKNVPAIISYSFYGKRPNADTPEIEWQTKHVPYGSHSIHAKFEGPDPEYWCHKGYAIVNYDPRGVGNSEGDIDVWSSREGRDGYDLIEWLAEQDWCSGKIGMLGNSALAMCQWRIASERPPHLACIAPWEGTADIYRETIPWGGFCENGFWPFLVKMLVGSGDIEDFATMAEEYPLMNAYWADKIPQFEKIDIPAYVTVGWNHFHLRGATMGYMHISSKQKWLRGHREFEWPDQYSRLGLEEATLFFDRFLKGIRNGFDGTPKVRLDVMDAYDFDNQLLRPEEDFPLPRTEYKKLYLDAANRSLSQTPVERESNCHYDGNKGKATFDITFDEETEFTGFMKLHMWVEADGNDDMDLLIAIKKLDPTGKWLPTLVMGAPHPGCPGKLRVSLREVDETHPHHREYRPWHPFTKVQKLKPGEIVPIEIEIYASSRIWHPGEQLQVEVMGHYERIDWFEPFAWNTNNKGNHVIHTGGKYDSYLLVPYIPPKYVAGNTVYR
jgi:predicted acyl esterase